MVDFSALDPQAVVVLAVALIGLAPVLLYRDRTSTWFVAGYGCLLVAAIATNFENLLLPDLLNLTEHVVGNMGAGVAFAVAAYMYRKRTITAETDGGVEG